MVIYLIIQFLVIYFSVKKWSPIMIYRVTNERKIDFYLETKEFWFILLMSLFWVVLIPATICWLTLDRLTKNINNKNK